MAESATGGGMLDMAGMLGAMGDLQENWTDFSQERLHRNASSPCEAEQEIGSYMTGVLHSSLQDAEEAALLLSDSLARAVNRSVAQWGREDPDVIGEQLFGTYLVDGGVVDSGEVVAGLTLLGFLTGNPFLGLMVDDVVGLWVDSHLPPEGSGAPQGTRSGTDKGFQVGPAAWLWAGPGLEDLDHVLDGVLRGDGVRAAYYSWRQRQREDVAAADHPNARDGLIALVGRGRPETAADAWRIWKPGDPIGGALYELRRFNAELRSDLEYYRYECGLIRARARDQQLAGEDLARTAEETKRWVLLAALAAALVLSD